MVERYLNINNWDEDQFKQMQSLIVEIHKEFIWQFKWLIVAANVCGDSQCESHLVTKSHQPKRHSKLINYKNRHDIDVVIEYKHWQTNHSLIKHFWNCIQFVTSLLWWKALSLILMLSSARILMLINVIVKKIW